MRRLGGASIQTQIVATRRIEPLMTKKLFDMSNRTAVEEECRGHGMPENMRTHRLCYARPPSIDRKGVLDPVTLPEAARGITLGDKECLIVIPPPGEVTLKPQERTVRKEEHAFLIAFPNDLGFFTLPVDIAAVQGQDLRDTGSSAQEHFHERPEAEPSERHRLPRGSRGHDGVHKALDFLSSQIHHVPPGDARDPNLAIREGGHLYHLLTEFQEGAQGMEDSGDPGFATPARGHLLPER